MKLIAVIGMSAALLSLSTMSLADEISKSSLANLSQGSKSMVTKSPDINEGSEIRIRALKEAAFKLGAQHGYRERIETIADKIRAISDDLDKIYNFSKVMSMSSDGTSEMYLVPPIVARYSDLKVVDFSASSLTIIDKKYVITKPARLVSTPLDWRQYIDFIPKAEFYKVPDSLLPEGSDEKQAWAESIDEGWNEGEQMAEREMLRRFESLVDDFKGIIIFNQLADQGKFARPELIKTSVKVAGDEQSLIENQVTYRIVTKSKTQLDPSYWTPTVLDNRESMIFPKRFDNVKVKVE